MNTTTTTDWAVRELHMERLSALNKLINLCSGFDISIKRVYSVANGFIVTFRGCEGDAALHDGTYGHECCYWETYKFPWDEDDVSVHTTEDLAELLNEYLNE